MTVTLPQTSINYPIHIANGLMKEISLLIGKKRVAIVTDDTVWRLYGTTLMQALLTQPLSISILPHGEASKTMDNLGRLYQDFVKGGVGRSDLIIAFGGGVVGDIAGFAAATWLRGLEFIQIPTTLLSMVDSSIGGKVAVDLPEGKNLVGAFHHPKMVLMDPCLLDTLPPKTLRDGIAEIAKAGYIRDAQLLEMLKTTFVSPAHKGLKSSQLPGLETLIKRALTIKKDIVEADEKEAGERKLLNFGHTLGHAIESQGGYQAITHGEGVALGMQWITRCSEAAGLTDPGTATKLESDLSALGFDKAPPLHWKALKGWVQRDKKMTGAGIDLVLIKRSGEGYIYNLKETDFDRFFEATF
jgi:3-dehydroquinate synthase